MFVVVVVFGSGTDYCLFITSRYKEEVFAVSGRDAADRPARERAMTLAWQATAKAVTASAATTICGLALMALAVFRAFQKAGPSVAVALAVGCLASLTLAPAVLLLLGRAAFWPAASGGGGESLTDRLWARLARLVTSRPGLIAALVVVLLALPAAQALRAHPTHNIFDELSDHWSSVRGFRILERDYTPGTLGPATLLIQSREPLHNDRGWQDLAGLSAAIAAHPLVAEVIHPARPLGNAGPTYKSPDDVPDTSLDAIERYFFSADRRAARLEILFCRGPYTDAAVAAARDLQDLARQWAARSSARVEKVMLAGPSSTIADIKDVAGRDFAVVTGAVLGAIYLILVVLLRRPVLSVILLLGTALSFATALGAADLLFVHALGQPGLDWKVKFFLLVLLVAVGVDYNIYVCTRIEEERRHRPLDDAVRTALARTGGIVSACGVIVAGTFASMVAGSLSLTVQLGFALTLGILVDTFLIRPLLVPAAALMLARFSERRRAAT